MENCTNGYYVYHNKNCLQYFVEKLRSRPQWKNYYQNFAYSCQCSLVHASERNCPSRYQNGKCTNQSSGGVSTLWFWKLLKDSNKCAHIDYNQNRRIESSVNRVIHLKDHYSTVSFPLAARFVFWVLNWNEGRYICIRSTCIYYVFSKTTLLIKTLSNQQTVFHSRKSWIFTLVFSIYLKMLYHKSCISSHSIIGKKIVIANH